MIREKLPAVSELDEIGMKEIRSLDMPVLIAYTSPDDTGPIETFNSAAEALRDEFLFGTTSDIRFSDLAGVEPPSIVLYSPLDEVKHVFREDFDKEKIIHFAKEHLRPLVGKLTVESFSEFAKVSNILHVASNMD